MKPTQTDDSKTEKQSANYWIVKRHGGTKRRIHQDKNCYQLQTSSVGFRRAHPGEIDSNQHCKWCDPDVEVDRSRTAERLHAKLMKMNPDDVSREAMN